MQERWGVGFVEQNKVLYYVPYFTLKQGKRLKSMYFKSMEKLYAHIAYIKENLPNHNVILVE